ncbi:MAG: FHA domain-containing protein [Acidobacteriota bacterium]
MKDQATAAEIIFAIVDNMEESLEPLLYRNLAPSLYEVYLHPDDFDRLRGVFPAMAEEARQALDERLHQLNENARPPRLLRPLLRSKKAQSYERAEAGWFITFHKNSDEDSHDIVIESHLTMPSTPSLGGGAKTKRIMTLRSGGETRRLQASYGQAATAAAPMPEELPSPALARIRYEDDEGPQIYSMIKDEIVIGRGGIDYWVDLKLRTSPEVSREHLRLRRDADGRFFIKDLSSQGTTVDDQPVPSSVVMVADEKQDRDLWAPIQSTVRIGLAGVLVLEFEGRDG